MIWFQVTTRNELPSVTRGMVRRIQRQTYIFFYKILNNVQTRVMGEIFAV